MRKIKAIWEYIITHKWSKDILRANLFYFVLLILYDLLHFSLRPVGWGVCFKMWLLMNLCLLFKLILNIIDKLIKRSNKSTFI